MYIVSSSLHPWSFTQRRLQARQLAQPLHHEAATHPKTMTTTPSTPTSTPTSTSRAPRPRFESLSLWTMGLGFVFLVMTFNDGMMASLLSMPSLQSVSLSTALDVRLLRLARVAAMALPLMGLLALPHIRCPRSSRELRVSSLATMGMAVGMVLMPTVLLAAAVLDERLKYLLAIPAVCTTLGVWSTAWMARQRGHSMSGRIWMGIGVSLTGGLLVGLWAFGGPLPAPAFVDDYAGPLRTWLRNGHSVGVWLSLSVLTVVRLRARRSLHDGDDA